MSSSVFLTPQLHLKLADICVCGHPTRGHDYISCEGSSGTCRCKKIWPLFRVTSPQSFLRPHTGIGENHALIQGVINHAEGLDGIFMANSELGRNPACYRCGISTKRLMPILVNRHSMKAVKEVAMGRMTRLWCDRCCELEEVAFVTDVAWAIFSAFKSQGDSHR